jgi:hypothetical protein
MKTDTLLKRVPKFVPALIVLGVAFLLAGCNLIDEGDVSNSGESGLTSAWVGMPLDSLHGASALEVHGDRLYVANRNATSPGVAAIDIATGRIAEYYPEIVSPSSLAMTASGHLVVAETDYVEGSLSVIDTATKKIRKSVTTFGSDNAAASIGDGKVYLFDHTTGAVTGFTGNTPGKNVVLNVQAGENANPYAIAVESNKAYITRYNLSSLLVLGDVGLIGGGARDSIDLSAYSKDTVKNIPYMAQVASSGGYVFVTLQRWIAVYPRTSALDTAVVLVINASTKSVEKVIPLQFKNPTAARVVNGVWYVSCLGNYLALDGGVEKINLVTRQHAGVAVTEAALGGDIGEYAPLPNGSAYVSYSADYFVTVKVRKLSAP